MPAEIFSLDEQREQKAKEARDALLHEGWRPLGDIVYTHIQEYGDHGFETRQIKTQDALKREILEQYLDEGFDEVALVPVNPYEKEPGSFHAFVRNPLMRGELIEREGEVVKKEPEKKQR